MESETSTDVLAFQEQRHHDETEKRERDEEIAGKKDSRDSKERVSEDRGGQEEEKGIIASFISSLVTRNKEADESNEAQDDRMDRDGKEERVSDVKIDEGGGSGAAGGGGGGIIETLVSHLPKTLPDDMAPQPEEASILLHSIVHD